MTDNEDDILDNLFADGEQGAAAVAVEEPEVSDMDLRSQLKASLDSSKRLEESIAALLEDNSKLRERNTQLERDGETLLKQPVITKESITEARNRFLAAAKTEVEGAFVYRCTPTFNVDGVQYDMASSFDIRSSRKSVSSPGSHITGDPEPFAFVQQIVAEIGQRRGVELSPSELKVVRVA